MYDGQKATGEETLTRPRSPRPVSHKNIHWARRNREVIQVGKRVQERRRILRVVGVEVLLLSGDKKDLFFSL